jgi:hypothetical protein
MAREYIVPNDNFTAGAISTVFVCVGTTASLEFLRAYLGQSGSATSAQQRVQLVTQTAGGTFTAQTPEKLKTGDPISVITGGAAGAAGTAGKTCSAEGGTKTVKYPDAFNVLNGWLWVPSPNDSIIVNASAAAGVGLYLPTAPSSTAGWNAGLVYRELG